MKYPILIATLVALVGCGKDDSSDSASTTPSIVGVWKSSCNAEKDGWYYILTLTNTATRSDLQVDEYREANCQTSRFVDTAYRTYVIGDSLSNGTTKIDFNYEKMERNYKSQESADAASKDKLFGFSDWKVGTAKDTSGLKMNATASTLAPQGMMSYLVFKVDGNSYYGADSSGDGTTAAKRPTNVTATLVLSK